MNSWKAYKNNLRIAFEREILCNIICHFDELNASLLTEALIYWSQRFEGSVNHTVALYEI